MINNFNLYSKYYDLLYNDKEYESEVFYVIRSIKKVNSDLGKILSLGSGTGRHDEVFKRLGYSILGMELSESMVDLSIKKGLSCIKGDISNFNLSQQFDTILSLFHVVSYLNSNEDINRMFSCVNNHLTKKGVFLMDVWFTPAVYYQNPEVRSKICENDFLKINRLATPEVDYIANIVKVNYDVVIFEKQSKNHLSFSEIHSMRHFSIPELKYFANSNGLDLIKYEEFLTSKPLSNKTWGACFTFKKL